MRNFRSLVLGLVLVSLCPLGWGEDVYYCVEEIYVELAPTDSGDTYELKRYTPEKFTFKYEADTNRLAIKGRTWGGDELFYLDCEACYAQFKTFMARTGDTTFKLKEGRFNVASAFTFKSGMKTGTCTKF